MTAVISSWPNYHVPIKRVKIWPLLKLHIHDDSSLTMLTSCTALPLPCQRGATASPKLFQAWPSTPQWAHPNLKRLHLSIVTCFLVYSPITFYRQVCTLHLHTVSKKNVQFSKFPVIVIFFASWSEKMSLSLELTKKMWRKRCYEGQPCLSACRTPNKKEAVYITYA